jgi:hypothetical protein
MCGVGGGGGGSSCEAVLHRWQGGNEKQFLAGTELKFSTENQQKHTTSWDIVCEAKGQI